MKDENPKFLIRFEESSWSVITTKPNLTDKSIIYTQYITTSGVWEDESTQIDKYKDR